MSDDHGSARDTRGFQVSADVVRWMRAASSMCDSVQIKRLNAQLCCLSSNVAHAGDGICAPRLSTSRPWSSNCWFWASTATDREWSHLAQIQPLDNADKHRLVLAAASGTRVGGWVFRDEEGNITTMPHDSFVPLQVDAVVKIAPARPGFVPPNLASAVAFMEPVFGHPMDHILRDLSRMTRQKVESCRRVCRSRRPGLFDFEAV